MSKKSSPFIYSNLQYIMGQDFLDISKGSHKKELFFFSGPATKALPPSPAGLVSKSFFGIFFKTLKKISFFSGGQGPYPPPPPPSSSLS